MSGHDDDEWTSLDTVGFDGMFSRPDDKELRTILTAPAGEAAQSKSDLLNDLLETSRQRALSVGGIDLSQHNLAEIPTQHEPPPNTGPDGLEPSEASEVLLSTQSHTENHNLHLTSRYEDLGLLGSGGMGVVRRIRDRLLNRTLAMKILHNRLLEVPAAVERFVQEAQVCAQLQHPNILPIHDLGVLDAGNFFITMTEIRAHPLIPTSSMYTT